MNKTDSVLTVRMFIYFKFFCLRSEKTDLRIKMQKLDTNVL